MKVKRILGGLGREGKMCHGFITLKLSFITMGVYWHQFEGVNAAQPQGTDIPLCLRIGGALLTVYLYCNNFLPKSIYTRIC